MESYQQVFLNYLKKEPITFSELRSASALREDFLKSDPELQKATQKDSFSVVTGPSEPFTYDLNDETDLAEEKRPAHLIIYDALAKTEDHYYLAQTIYNGEEETLTSTVGVTSTSRVEPETAWQNLEKFLEGKEWLPSVELLEMIMHKRAGKKSKLPKNLLEKLNYPNSHVGLLLRHSQGKAQYPIDENY